MVQKSPNHLLITTVVLVALGIIVIADASAPTALANFSDKYYFAKQQLVWAVAGLVIMVGTSIINYKFWNKLGVPILGFSILLLFLVLIPSLGTSALGARRWLKLGPVSLQPSEFLKLGIAFYFAKLAEDQKEIVAYIVPLGIVIFLVMLQPDLGSTLVVASIGLSQIFISGANLMHFFGILITGVIGVIPLILFSDYRRQRLMTFLESTSDPLGKSYHIRQILLALGSGGIFGVGIGQSRQKYLFLPEVATDSVFAIIGEEVGFLGGFIIIVLFMFFLYQGFEVARRAPDSFSRVLATGIIVWIGSQAFLNIGSNVAVVPLTGIPLPFLSYGGSSLIMILAAVGILMNISKYKINEKKHRRFRRKI